MNGEYKLGDIVLGSWTLVKLLGEGAYGRVYEAHREDFGTTYTAAIKIMTIPSSQSEIESIRAEGMSEEAVTAFFRGMAEDVVQEFRLMSELKGTTNIVSCEDHAVIPHTEGVGWDILIRMELLTPMLKYMSAHEMTRGDIIKLGIDMCKALELCQRYNIIHRDIKPENIFVSRAGDYKLGDFGVARTLEKTTGGLSKKGTYTYMAPEIYRDEKYGSTVDIYSLGIVLYRLLNNNRAPFLPPPPKPITHSERERSLVRRISGEQIPPPANAGARLAEIVLKACAYEPKERYTSPLLMRQELEAIQYRPEDDELIYGKDGKIRVERSAFTGQSKTDPDATVYEPHRNGAASDDDKTVYEPRRPAPESSDEATVFEPPKVKSASPAPGTKPEAKKKKTAPITAAAAILVLVIALIALLPRLRRAETASVAPTAAPFGETAAPTSEPTPEPTPAPTPDPTPGSIPEPTPEPEEEWIEGDWDWSVSGRVLKITGTGNMANYSASSPAPWQSNADQIWQIDIDEGITGIGDYAFAGIPRLGFMYLPKSVASIGAHAFENCPVLKNVFFAEGQVSIGDYAFQGCSMLTTLKFPNSLRVIGDYAFCDCVFLGGVTIHDGLAEIGDYAFQNTQMKRLSLPASVTSIGREIFRQNTAIARIDVAAGNPVYQSVGGVLFTQDGAMLLCYPKARESTVYTIPEGTVEIADYAFSSSNITSVTIPASVTRIGISAFESCAFLQTVSIPGSVGAIESRAFHLCQRLTDLELLEGVPGIGESAFSQCVRLTNVTIPASVTKIGDSAFQGCTAIKTVRYAGGAAKWDAMEIGSKNTGLTGAEILFDAA